MGTRAEQLADEPLVVRLLRVGHQVVDARDDANRGVDQVAVLVLGEVGDQAERDRVRDVATADQRLDVANQPDALADREVLARVREQVVEQLALRQHAVVAELALVREHPGGAALRRQRELSGRLIEHRAVLAGRLAGAPAHAHRDGPRALRIDLRADRGVAALRERERRRRAGLAGELDLDQRHAGLVDEAADSGDVGAGRLGHRADEVVGGGVAPGVRRQVVAHALAEGVRTDPRSNMPSTARPFS